LLEAVEASEARLKRKRERNRERESFFFSEKSFSENGAKLLPHHPVIGGGGGESESLPFFASPDDDSIQAAIEANDAFIAQLEQIRDRAQTLTIE
jgi:hypothetical protein